MRLVPAFLGLLVLVPVIAFAEPSTPPTTPSATPVSADFPKPLTRDELNRLDHADLVELAYQLQRRAILAEARPVTASVADEIPAPTTPIPTAARHGRIKPAAIAALGVGAIALLALSKQHSVTSGNSVGIASARRLPLDTGSLAGPVPVATTLPSNSMTTCILATAAGMAVQALTPAWYPNQETNVSDRIHSSLLNEVSPLFQAARGCDLPSAAAISVTVPTAQSTSTTPPVSARNLRPLAATTGTTYTTVTMPSVHANQCSAYTTLSNFWTSSGPSWTVKSPQSPVTTVDGGTPTAGTTGTPYWVRYSYVAVGGGETKTGQEWTITALPGKLLKVQGPPQENGAMGWNVYVSDSKMGGSNFEQRQNSNPLPFDTSWQQPDGALARLGSPLGKSTTHIAAPGPAQALTLPYVAGIGAVFQGAVRAACLSVKPNVTTNQSGP
jgi:hypothetical protein